MPDSRVGEVWLGPKRSRESSVYLVLRELGSHDHRVVNLMNGKMDDFHTRDIETDDNWEKLA